jgi:hypothetical protein
VHDRRINGETFVFGNAGGLYKNAMTWWDHKTRSIWSQPTGEVLEGELAGTKLELLPSQVTTWSNWVADHPQTFVMANDLDRLGSRRQGFTPEFVIGVDVGEEALAFYYQDVEEAGIVQTTIGDLPVIVWAAGGEYGVYLPQVDGQSLTFSNEAGIVYDDQTRSRWDLARGLALEGPLQGQGLQALPSLTSYDWAWYDFYPDSAIYSD